MGKNKRDCIVKKILEDDTNFEYGLDQNKSIYIRIKNCIAWEPFYEHRLQQKTEKEENIAVLYKHASGIQIGKNKKGEFYKKKKRRGIWTSFVDKKDVPIIYDLGRIIATKANHYWTQYGEDTIIKYKVISNKKQEHKCVEGYYDFVTADISNNKLYEKTSS